MVTVVMKADNPIPSLKKKKLHWLGRDVNAMRSAVEMCNLNHVPQTVRKVIESEAWREYWLNMKMYQFSSFPDFIATSKHEGGCGWEPTYVEALLEKSGDIEALIMFRRAMTGKRGGDRKSEAAIKGRNPTNVHKRDRGRAYTLDRLERERPDLFEQVKAGKLSANAAAIEAGFRKRPTSLERALKLLPNLTDLEWDELKRAEDQRRHLERDSAA